MVNYDFDRGVSVSTVRGKSSSSAGSHPNMGSSSDSPEYDVIGSTGIGGGGAGGASSSIADQSTKSRLIINEANPGDSGNYTCKPSNAVAASIQVFVSKNRGKKIHYFLRTQYHGL